MIPSITMAEPLSDAKPLPGQRLRGNENFTDWLHTFTSVAKAKGVWNLLTGKEELIAEEPKEEDVVVYVSKRRVPMLGAPSKQDAFNKEVDLNKSLLRYHIASAKYETSNKKAGEAELLLSDWVDEGVAAAIKHLSDVQERWTYLCDAYQPIQNGEELKKPHFVLCSDMHDYIDRHVKHQQELYRNNCIVAIENATVDSILHGLPSSYNKLKTRFDNKCSIVRDSGSAIGDLTTMLLEEEARLVTDAKAPISAGPRLKKRKKQSLSDHIQDIQREELQRRNTKSTLGTLPNFF